MADSVAAIFNLALSHVGSSKEVQLDTENSADANACRRFYEQARDEVIEAFPWPFATVRATLGLVATDPTPEWSYSYRYPSDCLSVRRLGTTLTSFRNPGPQQIIPYKIGRDSQGQLIYTDVGTANYGPAALEYVQRITDVTQFSSTFVAALALLLASYIAPRVTGGDPLHLGAQALNRYRGAILTAQANALNDEQPDIHPDAEWVIDRE